MKAFQKVLCGVALATLAMGAGVAAASHFSLSNVARADVVETEPVGVLHLDQTKVKGYTRYNFQTMEGHTGSEVTAYVFEADGNTTANPEIRFVTEGTEGSTKVAYDSAVTSVRFWYKLTNSSPIDIADPNTPYLIQGLDSQGKYPVFNFQPVVDGLWHSWCLEIPDSVTIGEETFNLQTRFAGFVIKMGDINGQLVVSDIEINVALEANEIGYFDVTKFCSWHCFDPDNNNEMLLLHTTGTDFPDASVYNVSVDVDKINAVGFTNQMKAVNASFNDLIGGQSYLNYWVRPGLLTFMPAGSGSYNSLILPKGLRIPSYDYFKNGVPTYFSLVREYKVTRINQDHSNVEVVWGIEKVVDESLILGDFTISQVSSFRAYSGDPTNKNEQVLVWVTGTDYIDVDGEGSMQQKIADAKFPNTSAHVIYGDANDETVATIPNIIAGEYYHNFTTRHPLFSFAPEAVLDVSKITFTEGLLIPSYAYISGGAESYYRLKYDMTATRLEYNTDSLAWNSWSIIKTGAAEKLGDLTFNSVQWCGHSNEEWGFNKVFIIIRFNETTMWDDFHNYNLDYSAYVSEDYYLNKIKVNGQLLSEYGSELLESFRANAIGPNQFAIVFADTFDDVYSFELLPGCRIPSNNKVDYFEINQHLIKSVHSPIFNAEQLDAFGPNFMHLDVPTSEIGTGLCKTEGWYAAAKAEFMGWDEYKRAAMYDFQDTYGEVMARLAAWARANGDSLPDWNIVSGSNRFNPAQQKVAINVSIIIVCVSVSFIAGVAIILTINKKKHQR